MNTDFSKWEDTRINKIRIKKIICALMIASIIIPGASLVGNAPGVYASNSGYHSAGCKVRVVQYDFSVPELGEYGKRYELFLDGDLAFCLQRGAPAKSNVTYSSMTYGTSYAINQALEYFYEVNSDRETYVLCQVYIWAIIEGKNPETAMLQAAASINSVYQGREMEILNTIKGLTPTQYYNVFESPTPGEQPIGFYAGNYMESPQYADVGANATATKELAKTINITKTDSSTGCGLEGAEFEVYVDETLLGTCVTDEEGKASIEFKESLNATGEAMATYCSNYDELPYSRLSWVTTHKYYNDALADATAKAQAVANEKVISLVDNTSHIYKVVEIKPRSFYCLPEEGITDSIESNGSGELEFAFENECIKGSVELTKTESGKRDVLLEGAKYGLYAKSDIVHPDGKTGVLYSKDELIGEEITDSKGLAVFKDLYMGDYYLKELVAPDGYELDESIKDIHLFTEDISKNEFVYKLQVEDEITPVIIEIKTDPYVPNMNVPTGDNKTDLIKNLILVGILSLLVSIECIRSKIRYKKNSSRD